MDCEGKSADNEEPINARHLPVIPPIRDGKLTRAVRLRWNACRGRRKAQTAARTRGRGGHARCLMLDMQVSP
jgi:hypothetical protein